MINKTIISTTKLINAIGKLLKALPQIYVLTLIILSGITMQWILAIYLLTNDFYPNSPLPIIIIASLVLSINWFIINLILSVLIVALLDQTGDFSDVTNIDSIFITSGLSSVLYLSLTMFVCYYWDFSFFWFLIGSFGYILFGFIRFLVGVIILSIKKSNQ